VLIAAHGNSLRALVKYLDNMSDADIMALNIPTGICAIMLLQLTVLCSQVETLTSQADTSRSLGFLTFSFAQNVQLKKLRSSSQKCLQF